MFYKIETSIRSHTFPKLIIKKRCVNEVYPWTMCPVSSIRKTMYKKRQAASTGMGVIVMKRLNI